MSRATIPHAGSQTKRATHTQGRVQKALSFRSRATRATATTSCHRRATNRRWPRVEVPPAATLRLPAHRRCAAHHARRATEKDAWAYVWGGRRSPGMCAARATTRDATRRGRNLAARLSTLMAMIRTIRLRTLEARVRFVALDSCALRPRRPAVPIGDVRADADRARGSVRNGLVHEQVTPTMY